MPGIHPQSHTQSEINPDQGSAGENSCQPRQPFSTVLGPSLVNEPTVCRERDRALFSPLGVRTSMRGRSLWRLPVADLASLGLHSERHDATKCRKAAAHYESWPQSLSPTIDDVLEPQFQPPVVRKRAHFAFPDGAQAQGTESRSPRAFDPAAFF